MEPQAQTPWLDDWNDLRVVSPWSDASFMRDATGVSRMPGWQNDDELLLWLAPAPGVQPRLLLRPPSRSATWLLETGNPPPPPGRPDDVIEGESWIEAPAGGPWLLVMRRSPARPPG